MASIRTRRRRKRMGGAFELPLTSLLDAFVIVVVFLLKSYSVSTSSLTLAQGVTLPTSTSPDFPSDSPQVIITPESITVEDERVLDFVQTEDDLGSGEAGYKFKGSDLDEGGKRIVRVYDALVRAKEKAETLRSRSKVRDAQGNPPPFDGALAIQADKRVQYDTVKRVMYTAGAAGYRVFRFIALAKDQ